MNSPDAFVGSQTAAGLNHYDARVDNGIAARSYVPLGEIAAAERDLVLKSLQRARIAAFVRVRTTGQMHLYVDALEYRDAHAVIVASGARAPSAQSRREADADDTQARFTELTQGWEVDTVAAIAETVARLEREDDLNIMSDALELDGPVPTRRRADAEQTYLHDLGVDSPSEHLASGHADHFVPPTPPPLPQMRPITLKAILLIVLGLILLGFGGFIDSNSTMTAFLGSLGILSGAALLIMNMRPNRDEYDDGAVL